MAVISHTSRAVVRQVDPGSDAYCAGCRLLIKFQARVKHRQVICNVYVDGRWNRVEHYHEGCYHEVGDPYGLAA